MDFPTLIGLIATVVLSVPGILGIYYKIEKKPLSPFGFTVRSLACIIIAVCLLVLAYFTTNRQTTAETNESIEASTESIIPIPLSQCVFLSDTNLPNSTSDVCVGTWFDTHGNIYLESIRFWVWDIPSMSAVEHVVYQLDREYSTLAGTFVAERDSSPDAQLKLLIYLDGQLQYESQEIGSSSEPLTFSIDISDANTIRIECSTDTPYSGYCIVSASVS